METIINIAHQFNNNFQHETFVGIVQWPQYSAYYIMMHITGPYVINYGPVFTTTHHNAEYWVSTDHLLTALQNKQQQCMHVSAV